MATGSRQFYTTASWFPSGDQQLEYIDRIDNQPQAAKQQQQHQNRMRGEQRARLLPYQENSLDLGDKSGRNDNKIDQSPIGRKLNQFKVINNSNKSKKNNKKQNQSQQQRKQISSRVTPINLNLSSSSESLKQVAQKEQRQDEEEEDEDEINPKTNSFTRILLTLMLILTTILFLVILIFIWPTEGPQIQAKSAMLRPRPKFEGPLGVNQLLDEAEVLFSNQFHAPESMAWRRDKRSFYTGVEGGFILHVEPYEERWTVIARLNSRRWPARDISQNVKFAKKSDPPTNANSDLSNSEAANDSVLSFVPFCATDVELYGDRAEFEPRLVSLSRCSRPLGIRLSPDDSYLYTVDPLSGIYKVQLADNGSIPLARSQVSKLVDFSKYLVDYKEDNTKSEEEANSDERIIFADDLAVDWANSEQNSDVLYLTDCSKRWTLRYLLRLMLENDDTGRVIKFSPQEKRLIVLDSVTPVELPASQQTDSRNLSFPNGLELLPSREALLISDLNNRRIIKHYIRGERAGTSEHLLWLPGYPDNVRRGLDTVDGRATFWAACGCAVSDGSFEIAEATDDWHQARKLLLKTLHFSGKFVELIGELFNWTYAKDVGLLLKSVWLKRDPYCTHGIVIQFDQDGQVLRSLHAPQFSSTFKLLSEAHEVPLLKEVDEQQSWMSLLPTQNSSSSNNNNNNNSSSQLFLGSVYYSFLGRIKLEPLSSTTT